MAQLNRIHANLDPRIDPEALELNLKVTRGGPKRWNIFYFSRFVLSCTVEFKHGRLHLPGAGPLSSLLFLDLFGVASRMNDLSIYTYLPVPVCETPKILSDLGRPTKRGIKKCPKCGVYNGTRGMICKNKRCDAVFKDYADKRKVSLDAVRLTGIVRQVYSVRVRDRGPDHRGFVQLPLLPSHDQDKSVLSENALCFVDSCQRLFDDSILKCHELEPHNTSLLCVHIDSAIKSRNMATPVELKREILSSLRVSKEIKTKLWVLATEKEGPLVQRVSRTVMAVKCQVTPKHPLGYLHFTFGCTRGREIYDKYYCSCTEFMGKRFARGTARYYRYCQFQGS
jgi:hypothetical protein